MLDIFLIVKSSAASVVLAFTHLILPAAFFLSIGFLVKRWKLVSDIRRATRETTLNLTIFGFNVVFVVPGLVLLSQLSHYIVLSNDLALLSPQDWSALPPILVILVGIFLADFVGYWRHRFEHTPLLWPSHAVHHSDTEMTWLTLERFHPVNRLTTFLIDSSVLLMLGFPAYVVVANSLVRHYYGFFIHADLPWTYGRMSWLFVSPAMHRWHHSLDRRFFETNFATVFSVFDRAFGTYRVPGPCTAPLGVTDDIAPTFKGQMTYMFQSRAYRRLVDMFKRRGRETSARTVDPME